MSRIGKKPIEIPTGVTVQMDGRQITAKGPKGELSFSVHQDIAVEQTENMLTVTPKKAGEKNLQKNIRALWGLTRALLANMIKGVTDGFEKKLELEGVGYRANVEGDTLILNVGYSNPVSVKAPTGISFQVEKNVITIAGTNKELVGEIAAQIRSKRPVEPYKGKGLRYQGEIVRRKAGKKGATA